MEAIESIEYKGFKINIHQDEDGANPREDFDNAGTMVCWHSRQNLGDKHEFADPQEAQKYFKETQAIVLPLYLYEHGGITMRTSGFSCQWDSGQVGFIYIERKQAIKEWGKKKITPRVRDRAINYLKGEVKEYDHYITGAVYGYTIEGIEEEDSCWGFYGYDHKKSGLLEMAESAIDYEVSSKLKKHFKQMKAWIKGKVPLIYRKPCPIVVVANAL